MNDPLEMQQGYDFIRSFIKEYEKGMYREETLYKMLPPSDDHIFSADDTLFHFSPEYTPFIISFTQKEEDLPMWVIYGDEGKGIRLEFDVKLMDKWADEHSVYINPVLYEKEYLDEEGKKLLIAIGYSIKKLIDEHKVFEQMEIKSEQLYYLREDTLRRMIAYTSAFVKQRDYNFEDEVRLVVFQGLSKKNVKYRLGTNHRLTPYIEVLIPITCLKRVVLGPSIASKENQIFLESAFKRHFKDIEISYSKVMYRE